MRHRILSQSIDTLAYLTQREDSLRTSSVGNFRQQCYKGEHNAVTITIDPELNCNFSLHACILLDAAYIKSKVEPFCRGRCKRGPTTAFLSAYDSGVNPRVCPRYIVRLYSQLALCSSVMQIVHILVKDRVVTHNPDSCHLYPFHLMSYRETP